MLGACSHVGIGATDGQWLMYLRGTIASFTVLGKSHEVGNRPGITEVLFLAREKQLLASSDDATLQ